MRKLHAGDIIPREMTQLRTFSHGMTSDPERGIVLEQWQGTLPVLPEDEIENSCDVYEHAEEPQYSSEYLGHGGQPAVEEQFDKACYQEVDVDDHDKRTDPPC